LPWSIRLGVLAEDSRWFDKAFDDASVDYDPESSSAVIIRIPTGKTHGKPTFHCFKLTTAGYIIYSGCADIKKLKELLHTLSPFFIEHRVRTGVYVAKKSIGDSGTTAVAVSANSTSSSAKRGHAAKTSKSKPGTTAACKK
jgi:hypothetical protein